jgi:hypothetical protein
MKDSAVHLGLSKWTSCWPSFYDILEKITPFMRQRDDTKAYNSSGSSIPVKTRLAVSLRWLAGGSYLDICFAWGIGHSTFYHHDGILWRPIHAAMNSKCN